MKQRRYTDGFTLIELLVVVSIMSILSAMVVLSMPSDAKPLRRGVEALAAQLQYAHQESVLSGQPIGLRISNAGYHFLRREGGVWSAGDAENSTVFRNWPSAEGVRIKIEGQFVGLKQSNDADELPSVVFDPTGMVTPFELELSGDDLLFIISVEQGGDVSVVRSDAG